MNYDSGFYQFLVKLIHVIAWAKFSFAVYYDFIFVNVPLMALPGNVEFGGKLKYLTFITAVIITVFFAF